MNIDLILLHLSLIEGVGPAAVQTLCTNKPVDVDMADIYAMSSLDMQTMFRLQQPLADKVVAGLADMQVLERELMLIQKHAINWMTSDNAAYPYLLKNIHMPPMVIYWRGNDFAQQEKALAIVGARKADQYGQQAVEMLVPPLVQHGWTIVSGGANGIDSMAHEQVMKMGGRTIAVLGSGLLYPYPLSNKKMFDRIAASGGTLVSSFPLTMQALPGHFPARNRIISGLSYGCVVVQAAQKSGALITAHYALEQGREVFAVPGSLSEPLSAGCHDVIKQGAHLVTDAQDIMQQFPYLGSLIGYKPTKSVTVETAVPKVIRSVVKMEQKVVDTTPAGQIVALCQTPCSLDELLESTQLDVAQMNQLLFDLQVAGRICQNFAGMWEKTGV